MREIITDILSFINSSDNFLITCHMNADGDAYASILAVAYYLNHLGKDYQIIIDDDKIDQKYNYLWGFDRIQSFSQTKKTAFDAAIVLDVPSFSRIGHPAELLPERSACVKIDHHPFEEDFAEYNLVDLEVSSTSHLVYELIAASGMEMTDALANQLFSGILYDTGRFSYSNTSRRDFEIAAELLRYQVSPSDISNRIFFSNSYQSMKTIGYGLANMESHLENRLAIIFLPLEVMERNNHSEIEELANYSVAIKNVEVGLFIREIRKNFFKVSFRSRGQVNVNAIAKTLDGGGHQHAAGARFEGEFPDLRRRLIREVEKQLRLLNP